MALYKNALKIIDGPNHVPSAAISFTSPPPVRPKTCPGNITTKPVRKPTSAMPGGSSTTPDAAAMIPRAATDNVSALGTRRVEKSIAALRPALAITAVTVITSESGGNPVPKQLENCLANRGHDRDAQKSNKPDEHRVLDQILRVVFDYQPFGG